MNNFNQVFLAIKAQSSKKDKFAEISNFAGLAQQANVPLDKLETYLKHLQDIGVIKYSMEDKYIYLTAFGSKTATLIKEAKEP